MGDGPTVAELPSPPTAFADPAAVWALSPSMLFHTTKFGRLEKLMPPWANQLGDDEIWNTVAYAWSLHTSESALQAGGELYAQECAACHGERGAGDGPDAQGELSNFTDQSYTVFASQADWLSGWEDAHADIGADWSPEQKANTLDYIRAFSYIPPWESPYRAGDGVIAGEVAFGDGVAPQVDEGIVFLDVYLGFDQIATFTTTLNADNTYTFANLGVNPDFSYLATVLSDGVSYSSAMANLTPEQPEADLPLNVYGVTDSPEGIRINRAHWILDSQPGALVVAQILLVGNDDDRTFVGQTIDGVDVPVTVGIQVPPDAQELSFENGQLGDRFRRVGDIVYDTVAVTPGDSTHQIIVQYALPYLGTSFDVKQDFQYPIDALSLLVANYPNLRVDVPAMTFDSVQNIQGSEYQMWNQSDFGPGEVEVKMQGLLERNSVDPRALEASGAGELAEIAPPMEAWVSWAMIAIVAAILLGLVGVAMQRGAFSTATTRQSLQATRNALLAEVARIDDLHSLGQLGDTEWLRRRAALKTQLMDVGRRLESQGRRTE